MPITAAANYTLPGAGTGFIPDTEASENLKIGFSRNPSLFSLPKYCKYQPVPKHIGLFTRFGVGEADRMLDTDGKEYIWRDGADRPTGQYLEDFRMEQFRATRYDFPTAFGNLTLSESTIGFDQVQQQFNLQKAMTLRTARAIDALTTVSSWDSNHVAWITAMDVGANSWESSLTTDMTIERSLMAALERISLDTAGVVSNRRAGDMVLVMSPTTARKVGRSQEIREYVKQQASSPEIVEGKRWGVDTWGLPPTLYGISVVIEDATKNTANRGATRNASYIMADGDAVLMFRPGTIDSLDGGGAFSTLHAFFVDGNELKVESKEDSWNRKRESHVVDFYDVCLVAPVTGFYFRGVTDTTSSAG